MGLFFVALGQSLTYGGKKLPSNHGSWLCPELTYIKFLATWRESMIKDWMNYISYSEV